MKRRTVETESTKHYEEPTFEYVIPRGLFINSSLMLAAVSIAARHFAFPPFDLEAFKNVRKRLAFVTFGASRRMLTLDKNG